MARMARTIQPATRPRSLLSSAKPGLAVALGLCLLAACKSVPAIDPGKPPAMDPASANTQPPACVGFAQSGRRHRRPEHADHVVCHRARPAGCCRRTRNATAGVCRGTTDVGRVLGGARQFGRCIGHAGWRGGSVAQHARHRFGRPGPRREDPTLNRSKTAPHCESSGAVWRPVSSFTSPRPARILLRLRRTDRLFSARKRDRPSPPHQAGESRATFGFV